MRCALAVIALLLWANSAHAQSAVNCPIYNTTAFASEFSGGVVVISNCVANSGPYDTIAVLVTGEMSCGPLSTGSIPLYAASAPPRAAGSNFTGSISSGVLTVNSMVTSPPFIIETGQTLFDAFSGSQIPNNGTSGSTLTVTGQLTGTTGGVGTYSVSNGAITVPSELMWSLDFKPGTSIAQIAEILENLNCQDGTTSIVNMQGIETALFAPNQDIWFFVVLTSEIIGGNPPQSASFNNGQITMFVPGPPKGGLLGGLGGAQ